MNKAFFFAGFILGIIVSLTAYVIMGLLSGDIKGVETPAILNNGQFLDEGDKTLDSK